MGTVAVVQNPSQAKECVSSLHTQFTQYYDAIGITDLEHVLRQRISSYLMQPRKSYLGMAKEIRCYLTERFEPVFPEDQFKVFLRKRSLSHTYIWKFHRRNESICITHMNTLANFLGVRFLIMNFEVLPEMTYYGS